MKSAHRQLTTIAVAATAMLSASAAFAQTGKINPADTAWMMASTGLVLMMTVPLRVKQEDEVMGLGVTQHSEALQ